MARCPRQDSCFALTSEPKLSHNNPPPLDNDLLKEAKELAQAAGKLTLKWFANHDLTIDRKQDGSPVTTADKAAEEYLRTELAKRFPADSILGEEFGAQQGSSQRQWIIDPIDGTRSFVRGVPLFATLLAMFDEHGPAIGIVDIPRLDETLWAGRGLGCYHNNNRCKVSSQSNLQKSYLCTSGFEWWPQDIHSKVAGCGARLRTWGDGYGYVLVATGRTEAMIDPGINLWDIAPMLVAIPEAGGQITTWKGTNSYHTDKALKPCNWVASNGKLHKELLSHLQNATS